MSNSSNRFGLKGRIHTVHLEGCNTQAAQGRACFCIHQKCSSAYSSGQELCWPEAGQQEWEEGFLTPFPGGTVEDITEGKFMRMKMKVARKTVREHIG